MYYSAVICSLGIILGNIHVGFAVCNCPHKPQYIPIPQSPLISSLFSLLQVFLLSHGLKNGNQTTRLIQRKEKHLKHILKKHYIGPSALHQWLLNSLRYSETGAPRLRSFLFAPISTQRGNRGLPELISLMNTQSFVEQHTAGPAVRARGLGLNICKPQLALVRKWGVEKNGKPWQSKV